MGVVNIVTEINLRAVTSSVGGKYTHDGDNGVPHEQRAALLDLLFVRDRLACVVGSHERRVKV